MNKAFTKETDYDESADAVVEPVDPLPEGAPNYVTAAGAVRVRAELRRLLDEEIPRLEALAGTGRESSGARDNEAKSKARRRLKEIKAQARLLESHVARFEVVAPNADGHGAVRFGARVTVLDEGDNERTYLICGVDEAEPETGAVSWISPIAKALLGREPGDEVTLRLPRGEQRLEILDVEYDDR
jgi:transcription elongation factor GreB